MSIPEIVSASAGSGKTHRIAEILRDAIMKDRVVPDAIIATTFTIKAAAELRERIRRFLLEKDQPEAAARLDGARIGTVNSVCQQLVTEFAFQRGLSPELGVLDEDQAALEFRKILHRVVDNDASSKRRRLQQRLTQFTAEHVDGAVEEIVRAARANDLTGEDLRTTCKEQSLADLATLRPDDVLKRGGTLITTLQKHAQTLLTAFKRAKGKTLAKTEKAISHVQQVLPKLSADTWSWDDWRVLASLDIGTRGVSDAVIDAGTKVCETAAKHERHPALWKDLEQAVTHVFDLAAKALDAYQKHKQQLGMLDFGDQEQLALRLLDDEEVQAHLRSQIKLLVVDEFQDTSPIQLAIFLKLAELVDRAVWVGDQKQAIYGFRDTDPVLMDTCIKQMKMGTPLDTSYRSRAPLVRLTSELFAPAFASMEIPADRVKLKPQKKTDDKELGPIVDHWRLCAPLDDEGEPVRLSLPIEYQDIAAGVQKLLTGKKCRVRGSDGNARYCEPRDIAVLCRKNKDCIGVAGELAALGIPAVVPRAGLLQTPECTALQAALVLWEDTKDSLAAAQLARLLDYPDDPDGWLRAAAEGLTSVGATPFENASVVAPIAKARKDTYQQGPVAVLDAPIHALDLPNLCARWGNSAQRMANVDALRALAVSYVDMCADQADACTVYGLQKHLDELMQNGNDHLAVTADADAVVVSTWHRAKGLEWPITILHGDSRAPDVLGVHSVASDDTTDLANPLAGRWIRYWLSPYGDRVTKTSFHERLAEHPASAIAATQDQQESLRLLYVGWTRARDRVVLAQRAGKAGEEEQELAGGVLAPLTASGGPAVGRIKARGRTTWAGLEFDGRVVEVLPADPIERAPKADDAYVAAGPAKHAPAYAQPSLQSASGIAEDAIHIGKPMELERGGDAESLGNAVHAFLAADRPDVQRDPAAREELAQCVLRDWFASDHIRATDLIAASDALRNWTKSRWPDAKWRCELPVLLRDAASGTVMRGSVDLVLETESGLVVIDHKTFSGVLDQAPAAAARYAGQLAAYKAALQAAQAKPVTETFIHFVTLGVVVPVA